MILNQFEGGSIGATMFGGLLKRGYPQIIHVNWIHPFWGARNFEETSMSLYPKSYVGFFRREAPKSCFFHVFFGKSMFFWGTPISRNTPINGRFMRG